MAGSSLLLLLDDLASVLDDVALLTKVAARKTSAVLGDDLALNAQQVAGVRAERELPVVWAVAKGSLRNKLILVPAALLISAFAPALVSPLLMVGGAYLCLEGFEKVAHRKGKAKSEPHPQEPDLPEGPGLDPLALEQTKVKGAVRTDFILSAEIIAITLGTVATAAFPTRVLVLAGVALGMTAGVYGLVAGIVKLDDLGLYLSLRKGPSLAPRLLRASGAGILWAAPLFMKALTLGGTVAMFLVGGGIITHGLPWGHGASHGVAAALGGVPWVGGLLAALAPTLVNALTGMAVGALALAGVTGARRLKAAFAQ